MKVVIIAGGKGTRIASVASDIPKSMIPVCGKPVVEYQIELAKKYGFTEFVFLIGHLGEQIKEYFGDGTRWGVHIEYYQESSPLGTGGALPLASDMLGDTFFVFYGDTVMDFDMEAMLSFHRSHSAGLTLFLHPNDHPFDSDLVEVDGDGYVSSFIFKPHEGLYAYRNLVNAALYVMDKKCLEHFPTGKCALEKDVFPRLLASGIPLAGYVSSEYIKDMGTPSRWESVGKDVASCKPSRYNRGCPRPAVFLDRDGTICEEVGLLHSPEQVRLIDGAASAIRMINHSGYLAVVVTNQPVIARNLCSIEELEEIHRRLEALLGDEGAYLDAIYYCPHHPDRGYPEERVEYKIECDCRKPKPGMLLRAAAELNIDLASSYMIGDSDRDVKAGDNASVRRSFLIETNKADALLEAVKNVLL